MDFIEYGRIESNKIYALLMEYKHNPIDEQEVGRAILILMQHIDILKTMYYDLAQEFCLTISDIDLEPKWMNEFYKDLMVKFRAFDPDKSTGMDLVQFQCEVAEKYCKGFQDLINQFELKKTKSRGEKWSS